ncbi:MAG: DUF4363 family protein, partial [Bacteroidota bacterium]
AERRLSATPHDMARLSAATEREIRLGHKRAAQENLRRLERQWAKVEGFWALITDHKEMDQIHLAIDRAGQYLAAGSLADTRAELVSLRFLLDHIPEKESLGIRSVL